MKKVLLLIIGFGLFYLNICASETEIPQPQPRRFVRTRGRVITEEPTETTQPAVTPPTGARRAAAARRTARTPSRARASTRGARATRGARTPARRGQRPAARQVGLRGKAAAPAKTPIQATLKKPDNLDVLIWNKLSEDQKKQFSELNTSFIETVSVVSKNINLWQKSVVERAKKIIDINSALVDYCIAVITAELEKTAEERNINAQTTSNFIANTLRTYALQSFIKVGTEKEQFNNLIENIILDPSTNMPTQDWVNAVTIRATSLIDKKELTIEQVKKSLTDGLKEASGQLTLSADLSRLISVIINDIVQSIEQKKLREKEAIEKQKLLAEKEQRESSPEYVYNWFQGLLLQVGDAANWNNSINKPNEAWVKNIIAAGKKMIAVFNIPLDDIEQQIGAQVYYIAATKRGSALTPQEEKSIIDLITSIKQQIGRQ